MSGLRWQRENEHAQRLLPQPCPFCRQKTASLWFDPKEEFHPFQVRCASCGAHGPKCDCGEESAVFMWLSVERRAQAADVLGGSDKPVSADTLDTPGEIL
jgi:hypothetical protein